MQIAALTHVYNEAVNLPIWLSYYGRNFGASNLYVFDHGSSDGSASDLGDANVIRVRHTPFDDVKKSNTVSALHLILLQHFDCVIATDCDEIIVADPAKYENLRQYIETTKPLVSACIGLHLCHVLTQEMPLDLSAPILSQRRIARFTKPGTKPLISSAPIRWLAGAHACNVPPAFDPELFVFHTKLMDYNIAMRRQAINAANEWSDAQKTSGHGGHHRYEPDRFVREAFLEPLQAIRTEKIEAFQFDDEIEAMRNGMIERNGMFFLGEAKLKYVKLPERFKECF